jgi:bifunctional DNA-binding transcriptional regulator/antitoxin component of YhaV-PrlF toxin-antitoxin module
LIGPTRIQLANKDSGSLRLTIPAEIVEEMGYQIGDVIAWDTVTEKGKKYARLRKLE